MEEQQVNGDCQPSAVTGAGHELSPKGLSPSGDHHAIAELVERCESAEGPDRELDDAIAEALFTGKHRVCIKGLTDEAGGMWMFHYPNGSVGSSLRFTGSLDAAMTLVPERGLAMARHLWNDSAAGSKAGQAVVNVYDEQMWIEDFSGLAATPALALTAACLRALSQSERNAP